jgi:hypothetical protein
MKKAFIVIFAVFGTTLGLFALDLPFPDWGADAVPDLYAPHLAGSGAFSTGSGGAPVSAINPAQGGSAQRIVFVFGYLGIAGLGEEDGYRNAIELGGLFPTRYGVFGFTGRFIQSPFDESFPIGWGFSGNLSFAKEISPGMSVGMGLNFGVGEEWMWSLNGDFGFHYNMGKLGPFHNFTWAAVLGNLGRSWAPTWFTPMGGVSFDLIRVDGKMGDDGVKSRDPFVLNTSFDIGIPSIVYSPQTSLIMKLGMRMEIAEIIRISVSWPGGSGLNARELADEGPGLFTALPSVGLGANITLPSGGGRIAGGRLPSDGDLAIDTAFKPLYQGVTALGAGATWTVGIADKRPPRIDIEYPEPLDSEYPVFFSPNNDGKADYLEFPLSITDERYVESWVWEINDEEGNLVRSYQNKE